VHLNSLLENLLAKLNIKLNIKLDEIDFSKNNGTFLKIEHIESIGPTVKDYSAEQLPLTC